MVPGPEHADMRFVEADPEEDDDERTPERILSLSLPMKVMTGDDEEGVHQRMMSPSGEETEPFETDDVAATPPVSNLVADIYATSSTILTHVFTHFPNTCFILPLSPTHPVLSPAPPPSPIRSLGYRAAMIRMRAEGRYYCPIPLHTTTPPFILSPTRPDAPSLGIPPPLSILVSTSITHPLLTNTTPC
ncbi:hypothetical protein Tco_0298933 [Tanacetum coccineum]